MDRRTFLAVGAAATLAGPAGAKGITVVPLIVGNVTADNSVRFVLAVAEQLDRIVGLKVTAEPTRGDAPASAFLVGNGPDRGAFISQTFGEAGGVQLNAKDAFLRQGIWVIDGFFTVKYGGMGQGILGYFLVPTDEALLRVNEAVRIQEVEVSSLPIKRPFEELVDAQLSSPG